MSESVSGGLCIEINDPAIVNHYKKCINFEAKILDPASCEYQSTPYLIHEFRGTAPGN